MKLKLIGHFNDIPVYYDSEYNENRVIVLRGPEQNSGPLPCLVYQNLLTGQVMTADGKPYVPNKNKIVIKRFIVGTDIHSRVFNVIARELI